MMNEDECGVLCTWEPYTFPTLYKLGLRQVYRKETGSSWNTPLDALSCLHLANRSPAVRTHRRAIAQVADAWSQKDLRYPDTAVPEAWMVILIPIGALV